MAIFDDQRAALDAFDTRGALPPSARPRPVNFDDKLLGSGERQRVGQLQAQKMFDDPRQLAQLLAALQQMGGLQGLGLGGGPVQGLGGAPNLGLGGGLGQGPGPQTTNLGRFNNMSVNNPGDVRSPFGPGLIFGGGRPFPPSQEVVDAFKTENNFAAMQNLIPLLQSAADALNKKK